MPALSRHLGNAYRRQAKNRQARRTLELELKTLAGNPDPALWLTRSVTSGRSFHVSQPVSSSVKKLLCFPLLQLSQAYYCIILMIIIFIMAAVYSFNKFLLSTHCGPGPVFGAGDSSVNKTDKTPPLQSMCSPFATCLWTERNFTGIISFGIRATLKGEGIVCSILLLWKVRRCRLCELPGVSQRVRGGDETWTLNSGPKPGSWGPLPAHLSAFALHLICQWLHP